MYRTKNSIEHKNSVVVDFIGKLTQNLRGKLLLLEVGHE